MKWLDEFPWWILLVVAIALGLVSFVGVWLLIMLILSKSLGALVIAVTLGAVAFMLPSRAHLSLTALSVN